VRTTKISIAIDKKQLSHARAAAKREGVSLSAFIGRALATELDEEERIRAARALVASWGAEAIPTAEDRREFRRRMARPRSRRSRAA
jgi:hypothetical protein